MGVRWQIQCQQNEIGPKGFANDLGDDDGDGDNDLHEVVLSTSLLFSAEMWVQTPGHHYFHCRAYISSILR